MKILVCGSRNWDDVEKINQALLALATDHPLEIINGGARGADEIAHAFANNHGIQSTIFAPDWSTGRGAGFERNLRMLDEKPDLVLAFQVGQSRGTQHTIDHARKRGIPVKVYYDN